MQQMQLWIFWAIVGAFIVCGCILTRKPTKKPPTETLRPAMQRADFGPRGGTKAKNASAAAPRSNNQLPNTRRDQTINYQIRDAIKQTT